MDAPSGPCDVTAPFGAPVLVDGVNTGAPELWGWLSEDQQTIYFNRVPAGTPHGDLFFATRSQPTGPFTGAAVLEGVNTANGEARPVLTADGRTLFLEFFGPGAVDVHTATRASTAAVFEPHVAVATINQAASDDFQPWISDDGLVMYFVSSRTGVHDIFKATRSSTSNPFGAPVAVGELNSPTVGDFAPVLSQDGLEIFFASKRAPGDLGSCCDIFHATRSTPTDGFGTPTLVAELSLPGVDDFPSWVSPDRCQVMFTSTRGGGAGSYDIWIATRPR